jgi:hypothetical protein
MQELESFIDVLNDPEGRSLVDQIEDVLSSLKSQPDNPALKRIRDKLIDELEQKTGYRYTLE